MDRITLILCKTYKTPLCWGRVLLCLDRPLPVTIPSCYATPILFSQFCFGRWSLWTFSWSTFCQAVRCGRNRICRTLHPHSSLILFHCFIWCFIILASKFGEVCFCTYHSHFCGLSNKHNYPFSKFYYYNFPFQLDVKNSRSCKSISLCIISPSESFFLLSMSKLAQLIHSFQ